MISLYFYWLIYLKRKLEAASFTHFAAHHSRHLFHEFLALLKLFDQTIDFCDINSCASGDAVLAGYIQDSRIGPLLPVSWKG